MTKEDILNNFLYKIKDRLSPITFNCIIKDLKIYSFDNNKMVLIIPSDNELLLQSIKQHYSNIIEEVMNEITNSSCEIEYLLDSDINILDNSKLDNKKEIANNNNLIDNDDISNYSYNNNLISKYTFDTFVVGESNKLAYGTALAVAKNPGKLYNPYFIYASSGLGKTHLMHAIGNYIVTHSDKKVLYITAEQFSIDYISIVNIKKLY